MELVQNTDGEQYERIGLLRHNLRPLILMWPSKHLFQIASLVFCLNICQDIKAH